MPAGAGDLGRTGDAQRMMASFDPQWPPGQFAFIYMAIELGTMVGRRVDLSIDKSMSSDHPGVSSKLTKTLLYSG